MTERKKDGDRTGVRSKHESPEEGGSVREEENGRHWWLGHFERQRSSFYISHPGAPRTAGGEEAGRRCGGGVWSVGCFAQGRRTGRYILKMLLLYVYFVVDSQTD